MLRRAITTACCLVAAGTALGGCAPSPGTTGTGSARPTASAHTTATPTPKATPTPAPPGPFAVVVTNNQRTGVAYEVMLINDAGQIVAHTNAQLPTLQPNQTLTLPLVSVSNSTAYFLEGNTSVDSLTPSGAVAAVMSIPDGSSAELAFAVSPDDQQIAIAEINEQSDVANDTSKGYIEDLVGGGNQVSLWNNSGTYALRWPAGWDGSSLIDEVASGRCGGPACGGNSYHVVDPSTGDATAAVCQTPSSQPSWGTPNATITSYSLEGLPTAAGTACFEYADSFNAYGDDTETTSLDSMSWGGASATFTQAQNQYGGLEYNACELSPDGSQMACTSSSNNALTLVSSNGTATNTGRTYNGILGWIDASHLLVEVDSGDLGVFDPATGVLTTLAVPQADQVEMVATLPGGL
ncbi:MAG: hypothetical protein WB802_10860 [Candidatus Dormiibacterota bacterium]